MPRPDDMKIDRLFSAVRGGQHDLIKELLPESGWDINKCHRSGPTLLMLASMSGKIDAVRAVLAHGSNHGIRVDATNSEGCTALTCAADQGHREICELLLAYGAKVNHLSKKGSTPLMHACCSGHLRVVQLLLKNGANPNIPSSDQWSPLLHAANSGHAKIVSALLNAGAVVDAATDAGITPMMRAAGRGRLECVKLLLAAGANVNKRGGNGCSALIFAAANGHTEVCATLVQCGADPKLRDGNGLTALDAAVKHGEGETESFLRSVENAPHIRRQTSNNVSFLDSNGSAVASHHPNGHSSHNSFLDRSPQTPPSELSITDSQVGSYSAKDMLSKVAEKRSRLRSASHSNSPFHSPASRHQSPNRSATRSKPHNGVNGGNKGRDGDRERRRPGSRGKKELMEISNEPPPLKSKSFLGELFGCCTGSGTRPDD